MLCVHVNGTDLQDYVEQVNRLEAGKVIQIHHVRDCEALIYLEEEERQQEHCGRKCAECSRYKWGIGCVATGEMKVHRPTEEACPFFSTDPIYEHEVDDFKQEARWKQ